MWITKQKHRLILAAVSVVAGCASLPANVKPLDTDTYQLSVTGTRYQSQADTNFKAFTAANDYCGSLGKTDAIPQFDGSRRARLLPQARRPRFRLHRPQCSRLSTGECKAESSGGREPVARRSLATTAGKPWENPQPGLQYF